MNLRTLLLSLRPRAGRMSPREAANFGRSLEHGIGFVGMGPVVLLFDLPPRFRRADPPLYVTFPSIEEINQQIRTLVGNANARGGLRN